MGNDWGTTKFRDLYAIPSRNGLTKPKRVRGQGVKFINMGEIFKFDRMKNIPTDRVPVTQREFDSSELKNDDLLFARQSLVLSGAGKCSIFMEDSEPVVFESHLIRVRPNKQKIDANFLYYFFQSPQGRSEIWGITEQGAGQAGIRGTDLETLNIPLPPPAEQKAIAHILGSLDDKIELNRQMNETLESMAQALFKSWFVDFDPVIDNALAAGNPIPDALKARAVERAKIRQEREQSSSASEQASSSTNEHQALFPSEFEYTEEMGWIPKGWISTKLSELLEVKYGKDHKKLEEGNIPVYGSGGLIRHVNKSLYSGKSILIPRKGTLSNLMFVDETFWSVDTMFFSIPKVDYSAKYLFYCLKRLDFSSMNVGSAVPSMTTKVLNDLNVLQPETEVLKQFDVLANDFFTKQKGLDQENKSLEKLRDTLLPKLLSGELRIPDAEKLIKDAGV